MLNLDFLLAHMGEEVKWAQFSLRILQFHPQTYMSLLLVRPGKTKGCAFALHRLDGNGATTTLNGLLDNG